MSPTKWSIILVLLALLPSTTAPPVPTNRGRTMSAVKPVAKISTSDPTQQRVKPAQAKKPIEPAPPSMLKALNKMDNAKLLELASGKLKSSLPSENTPRERLYEMYYEPEYVRERNENIPWPTPEDRDFILRQFAGHWESRPVEDEEVDTLRIDYEYELPTDYDPHPWTQNYDYGTYSNRNDDRSRRREPHEIRDVLYLTHNGYMDYLLCEDMDVDQEEEAKTTIEDPEYKYYRFTPVEGKEGYVHYDEMAKVEFKNWNEIVIREKAESYRLSGDELRLTLLDGGTRLVEEGAMSKVEYVRAVPQTGRQRAEQLRQRQQIAKEKLEEKEKFEKLKHTSRRTTKRESHANQPPKKAEIKAKRQAEKGKKIVQAPKMPRQSLGRRH